MRVCFYVGEFGEPSADAGSLGHSARVDEEGKLLLYCGKAGRGGGGAN